ncbi:beta-N-acetylhexosaminidase [Pseudooceanicola sp. CBS1P-1]|uniref:beta-N-acetylhexosaminidase n=1 Tax=Pseudooceanicola albus TaxID=2692189 RepID=A0A6L7G2B7_9RHOB|nr:MULTISPECIES: beta-N-acetylhexosaminidase [Pseudooceanicola]MBT9385204.1 beta-N-acetylhexosaminidase [Pseudooceanicola endophyticus]MXN18504.1 family 20 glycosylhydrolase [Pseudooceanicola albus]
MTTYRLEAFTNGAPELADCRIEMVLHNLSDQPLSGAVLAMASITRMAEDAQVFGADIGRRFANYHEFTMPAGLVVPPGGTWSFGFIGARGLPPRHRTDGPKSAVLLRDGAALPVTVGDLHPGPGTPRPGPAKQVPETPLDLPLMAIPWPAALQIDAWQPGHPISLPPTAPAADRAALDTVAALHKRLFPEAAAPLHIGTDGLTLTLIPTDLPGERYRLDFAPEGITLRYGSDQGRFNGLVALAQMTHGALSEPGQFQLPAAGAISDAPRFGWRGAHLDVSRHFWSVAQVMRFLDTMAWARMNRFQWHLTDDEGWRAEILAYPELTRSGAERGPGLALPGQYAHVERRYHGHYTRDEMRAVVAHAAALGIEILPEIDIPGHCTAVLAALPHLVDPDEPADSYRSVQGYPNNALNPALPQTWDFLETVIAELAELFPGRWIHVGADEVPEGAWMDSPAIQRLAQTEGLQGTAAIQSWFLRRVQQMLRHHGKELAGWDEVSHGAGVDQENTLLVAWQRPDLVPALAAQGYRVIASPGQAYYLDMVQAEGWSEPGTAWAGTVTPEVSYAHDPEGMLPEDQRGALAGIQACIWCEHIYTPELFNHMVYPRLHGVAEAGWTPQSARNWPRFATLSARMPRL